MNTIDVSGISKHFAQEIVLDNVSLSVDAGETLVLFGPSGAGKTVLLRLIAGVIDADDGQIAIAGENMQGVEPEHRGVGMAFQNFALFPHMSAFDNIASALSAGSLAPSEIQTRVNRVADMLKITHVLQHTPRELSNGQKQRTALARALVGEPPVLLLDDPLRNVDAKLRFEMRLELPRLLANRGATVIYVTQDYKEAMALGDRIAVLTDGSIDQIGTPEAIYHTPATLDIARLFGDPTVNLFEVTVKRGVGESTTQLSGVRIALQLDEPLTNRQSCIMGIRPEHIRFVPETTPHAIPVTIEAETPLNEKVVTLAVTEGGREVLISRPAGSPAPTSATAHIAIKKDSIMLFDRATGRRIATTANAPTPDTALRCQVPA